MTIVIDELYLAINCHTLNYLATTKLHDNIILILPSTVVHIICIFCN